MHFYIDGLALAPNLDDVRTIKREVLSVMRETVLSISRQIALSGTSEVGKITAKFSSLRCTLLPGRLRAHARRCFAGCTRTRLVGD